MQTLNFILPHPGTVSVLVHDQIDPTTLPEAHPHKHIPPTDIRDMTGASYSFFSSQGQRDKILQELSKNHYFVSLVIEQLQKNQGDVRFNFEIKLGSKYLMLGTEGEDFYLENKTTHPTSHIKKNINFINIVFDVAEYDPKSHLINVYLHTIYPIDPEKSKVVYVDEEYKTEEYKTYELNHKQRVLEADIITKTYRIGFQLDSNGTNLPVFKVLKFKDGSIQVQWERKYKIDLDNNPFCQLLGKTQSRKELLKEAAKKNSTGELEEDPTLDHMALVLEKMTDKELQLIVMSKKILPKKMWYLPVIIPDFEQIKKNIEVVIGKNKISKIDTEICEQILLKLTTNKIISLRVIDLFSALENLSSESSYPPMINIDNINRHLSLLSLISDHIDSISKQIHIEKEVKFAKLFPVISDDELDQNIQSILKTLCDLSKKRFLMSYSFIFEISGQKYIFDIDSENKLSKRIKTIKDIRKKSIGALKKYLMNFSVYNDEVEKEKQESDYLIEKLKKEKENILNFKNSLNKIQNDIFNKATLEEEDKENKRIVNRDFTLCKTDLLSCKKSLVTARKDDNSNVDKLVQSLSHHLDIFSDQYEITSLMDIEIERFLETNKAQLSHQVMQMIKKLCNEHDKISSPFDLSLLSKELCDGFFNINGKPIKPKNNLYAMPELGHEDFLNQMVLLKKLIFAVDTMYRTHPSHELLKKQIKPLTDCLASYYELRRLFPLMFTMNVADIDRATMFNLLDDIVNNLQLRVACEQQYSGALKGEVESQGALINACQKPLQLFILHTRHKLLPLGFIKEFIASLQENIPAPRLKSIVCDVDDEHHIPIYDHEQLVAESTASDESCDTIVQPVNELATPEPCSPLQDENLRFFKSQVSVERRNAYLCGRDGGLILPNTPI